MRWKKKGFANFSSSLDEIANLKKWENVRRFDTLMSKTHGCVNTCYHVFQPQWLIPHWPSQWNDRHPEKSNIDCTLPKVTGWLKQVYCLVLFGYFFKMRLLKKKLTNIYPTNDYFKCGHPWFLGIYRFLKARIWVFVKRRSSIRSPGD